MEHTTVPQMLCVLSVATVERPGPMTPRSSPAQFVLLISHSIQNVMQCKELFYYSVAYAVCQDSMPAEAFPCADFVQKPAPARLPEIRRFRKTGRRSLRRCPLIKSANGRAPPAAGNRQKNIDKKSRFGYDKQDMYQDTGQLHEERDGTSSWNTAFKPF